jgi:GDP-L-fucose synthase
VINQRINTNVVECWRTQRPKARLICMGTRCSYDENLPLLRGNFLLGDSIRGLLTHAMTKRTRYVGLLALRKQFGLTHLHVVPSTLYGPGYHEDGRQLHFIFDLIRKTLRGKQLGEPVVLWGDGYHRRELVYIHDFAAILLHLVETSGNETVHFGAGKGQTIRDFAQMNCATVDFDADNIQYATDCDVGARSKCSQIEHLPALVPKSQFTPLERGLAGTVSGMEQRSGAFLGPQRTTG